MEQNKIEKQFKEQLNSREIKPSEMAWDRLDAMLTVAEEKKPKRSYSWIYIAASFVGFLLIGTLFFNQKGIDLESQKDKIVNQQFTTAKSNIETSEISNSKKNQNEITTNIQKIASKEKKNRTLKNDSLTLKNSSNKNQLAEISIINQKKEQEFNSLTTKNLTVDELLASVNQSTKSNSKTNPNLKVHVNANQLLQELDNELEPTFRQNVFNKVVNHFEVIKEAVANRNKE